MSKISVIVPAYNTSQYLMETIQSVQAQTFLDWELILVDDCSSDDTFHVAKQLAVLDTRIKVYRNKVNAGVAVTRNRALDYASGDFIAFLDSDDVWVPDKLQRQLDFMQQGNYALTYTAYQVIDAYGEKGKVIHVPARMKANQIFKNTSIGCLTVMVNRAMVGDFYMPRLSHFEDQATWIEILRRGYVGYGMSDVLAYYRVRNNALTHDKTKAAMKQLAVYRDYYDFSLIKSSYYFLSYAFNALRKHYLS